MEIRYGYAKAKYATDGVTQNFAVPFPYLKAADVFIEAFDTVTGDPIASISWTFINSSLVKVLSSGSAIPAGYDLWVERNSAFDGMRVDFADGSTITETALDLAYRQSFFVAQEALDTAGMILNSTADIDDAVDEAVAAAAAAAATIATVAASATSAATSATNAATSATNAATSATQAAVSAASAGDAVGTFGLLKALNLSDLANVNTATTNLKLTLNAKHYGAVGDGVTNDGPALRAAMLAIYTAGGGTLYLPPGIYITDDVANGNGWCGLPCRDQVNIDGAGMGTTIIKLQSGSLVDGSHGVIEPLAYGTALPAVGYYNHRVRISNLSIDGNIAGNPGKQYEGIAGGQIKELIVDSVEAYSCGECGYLGQVANMGTNQNSLVAFNNCTAHDNVSDGWQLVGGKVENCLAYNNGGAGFNSVGNLVLGLTENVVTMGSNCHAYNNAQGGFSSGLQIGPHIHTLWSNCFASRNGSYGFSAIMKYTSHVGCQSVYNAKDGFWIQAEYCSITGGLSLNNGQTVGGVNNFRAGLVIAGSLNHCNVSSLTCTDDQGTKTQQYGLAFSAPGLGANNVISNCDFTGNANALPYQLTLAADWRTHNNNGVNPTGVFGGSNPANPAVPPSGTVHFNTYGYPCQVVVTGGANVTVILNGTSTGLASGTFTVGCGQTLACTYTSVPTWTWFGL